MSRSTSVALCLAMILLLGGRSAPAAEEQTEPSAASSAAATPEEIKALVEQFDSDKYAERQAASEKLGQIGKPAIPALIEAATGDSLEATVRSIEVLRKLLESSDEAMRDAAKEALGKVAESDRPSAARRAQDALKAFEARQTPAGAFQPNMGVIQLGVAGGGRRVSVRNVDGVKTIEAEEGNQKVKIVDDPKQGIQMEVTDKKDDGKETTEKFEAKDAEDLKKKHPKAYEIYNKYSQMGGGVVMQVQMGGNIQAIAPARRVNAVETAARVIGSWGQTLDRLASEEAIKEAPKESNEELKKKIGEMKEYLDKIEERLDKAIEASEQPAKEEPAKDE